MRKLLLLLVISHSCLGQSIFDKTDVYLDSLAQADQFSGYLLIAQHGKIKLSKGYGYANRELNIENKAETKFNLSSTSKLFTGVAIAQLIQSNKISKDDFISKYIDGLAYGDKVTIQQLLNHSSGLTNYQNSKGFKYDGIETCMDIVPFIKDQELLFTPGDSVRYGTTGLILLGGVVEQVSGLSFQDYLQKKIFDPLHMTHTSFVNYGYVQDSQMKHKEYAKGYILDSDSAVQLRSKRPSDHLFVPLSSGGIWSSASDIYKLDQALFRYHFLTSETLQESIQPYTFTGWKGCYFGDIWMNINTHKPTHAVGHAGNASGHHNQYYHYDKDDTTIILLTNFGFVDIFQTLVTIEEILFETN